MEYVFEWRSRTEGDDSILAIDVESNTVVKTWVADTELLMDFLNDMERMNGTSRNGVDYSERTPDEWGRLVLARSDAGDVLRVEPELYWAGVGFWFRSRGLDPHPYHPVN